MGNLFSINTDGTGITQLTTDPTTIVGSSDGALTYDGSKVVYSKQVAGNWDVYIQNTDGTNEIQLTTDIALDSTPVISAGGSKVTFISMRNGNSAPNSGMPPAVHIHPLIFTAMPLPVNTTAEDWMRTIPWICAWTDAGQQKDGV